MDNEEKRDQEEMDELQDFDLDAILNEFHTDPEDAPPEDYRSVGWLDSNDSAVRTWLTDRSAGVRSKSIWYFQSRNCRTGATGRSTRYMLQIPRILCLSIIRSLSRASHRKFIHISLSDHNCTCFFQVQNCFC